MLMPENTNEAESKSIKEDTRKYKEEPLDIQEETYAFEEETTDSSSRTSIKTKDIEGIEPTLKFDIDVVHLEGIEDIKDSAYYKYFGGSGTSK
jgi:hypothetical protein